ncbi:YciI family protein [Aquincola tertiaricarbonis]|uniref:YciI family protein n=1 Tax=Aquincola tertiaricarbonis TaxID=391953 RepID=A0ABY4S5N2_AQUTE|nr:YciI family protein [Aquincola tertiaricarbonis]URI06396.1 YciI family protein [Aquincola tertiaricarbonis]
MQFMLIFNESTAEAGRRDDAADAAYWGAWNSYVMAMFASGCARSGHGLLHPRTGTRVRVVSGKRQVQDGPIADAHEHLGGYFVVDVPTLDVALEWAARAPCASAGSVEVRPVLPPPLTEAAA